MKNLITTGLVLAGMVLAAPGVSAQHLDISPYLVGGRLLTGGRDHGGASVPPPVRVYGYDFGEDPFDPFNQPDPGVNQAAGVGDLPAGGALRYNILSSLQYWDGSGEVELGSPPGDAYLALSMGASQRALTGVSGPQTGSLVQSVLSDGSVHRHFVASLYSSPGAGNVPGEAGFVAPPAGIYAFELELTLDYDGATLASDPFWIAYNNGLGEEAHDAALEYLGSSVVPEPAGGAMVLLLATGLIGRRRAR